MFLGMRKTHFNDILVVRGTQEPRAQISVVLTSLLLSAVHCLTLCLR